MVKSNNVVSKKKTTRNKKSITDSKAKAKAKPVVKVTKTKKVTSKTKATKNKAKTILDKIDVDTNIEDLDDLDEQINYDMSAESLTTDAECVIDTDTDMEILSDESDNSEEEIEQVEYDMDEYETNQVGTERHGALKEVLYETFGYRSFKPDQYRIIDSILDGMDVLGVMPTGYGKSMCFQLPPLVTDEVSIVISPLIALMADQQDSMDKLGINSCCYNSTIGVKRKKEIEEELINGHHQLLYVTPESLDKPEFRRLIDRIYTNVGICMIAVDEAHCVSSYGFDFRPKYRNIVKIRKFLPDVPVLAVTATATDKVMKDINTCLSMDNAVQIKTSFDRPNIFINVRETRQNSFDQIAGLIQNCGGPSIVYCLTKKETDQMNTKLKAKGIKSVAYHADMKKDERTEAQTQFMTGKVNCICATVAFGMGINKTDVRLVIHQGCPKNIESYYQEIGRAGRDGKDSECWLFFRQSDFRIQRLFIEKIQDPIYKTTRTQLLYIITKYINDKKCRRKNILSYFSEVYKKDNCGKCDNCCSVQKAIPKKNEADLFKLLSAIFEMDSVHNQRFGKNKIKLIMRGSNAKGISKWMKELPYYGAFQNKSVKETADIIDSALEIGYLENYHVGDLINVIKCTDYGLAFGQEYEKKLNRITEKEKKTKKESRGKITIV